MHARQVSLSHPQAGAFDLPLLIPSFSTKGFEFLETRHGKGKRKYSEIVNELANFAGYESKSVLVSAYDLHFGHFNGPRHVASERYLRNSALVFIDSGGYELISDFDLTEFRHSDYHPKGGYGPAEYCRVLDRLTSLRQPLPLVITNFDHGTRGRSLDEQIAAARRIFQRYGNCATSFIIRPWTSTQDYVDPRRLSDRDIAALGGFDIIGATEKELGRNLIDRLKGVAMLRRKLDEARIRAPIQIWGGLDPLNTPLLFFAGADIFDGVSWLRYAYARGVAMNRESFLLLSTIGVTASRTLNHAMASRENLTAMEKLAIALRQWVDLGGERFDMFDPSVSRQLEEAYRAMCTRIPDLREGV